MKLNFDRISRKMHALGCLLLLTSVISCSHAEPNTVNILQEKPVFSLKIHAYNTSYFVYLNGALVQKEFSSDGQVTMTLPVNHWMHPQNNVLGLAIAPPEEGASVNKNANVRVELTVHPSGEQEKTQIIGSLVFEEKHLREGSPTKNSTPSGRFSPNGNPAHDGIIMLSGVTAVPIDYFQGAVRYDRAIEVPSSLPLWAFFSSDELPDYDAMNDEEYERANSELFVEYMKIQKALQKKDIDSIMPLFEERNRETDLAFYFSPGTTQKELKEDFLSALSDDDLMLVDLTSEMIGIDQMDNRKLVSMTRDNFSPAIAFNFKSQGGSVAYNLIYRKQNGKWIITR